MPGNFRPHGLITTDTEAVITHYDAAEDIGSRGCHRLILKLLANIGQQLVASPE